MPTARLCVSTSKKLAPQVSEALFAAGAQGLEERLGRGATLVVYAESKATLAAIWKRAAHSLSVQLGADKLPKAAFDLDHEERWRTTWIEYLRPIELTRRLVLAPTSGPPPQLSPRQELLVYRPALAFGDGDHATTRLAARAIEAHYRRAPGGALLDIGTGTGVLSLVAVRSGARHATGTDLDPEAVLAALENARLNGISRRTRFVGAQARLSGAFDLLVINIELRPLLGVLGALPAAALRVPKLLLTGFLRSQMAEVKQSAVRAGFRMRLRASEGDWILLEGSR